MLVVLAVPILFNAPPPVPGRPSAAVMGFLTKALVRHLAAGQVGAIANSMWLQPTGLDGAVIAVAGGVFPRPADLATVLLMLIPAE